MSKRNFQYLDDEDYEQYFRRLVHKSSLEKPRTTYYHNKVNIVYTVVLKNFINVKEWAKDKWNVSVVGKTKWKMMYYEQNRKFSMNTFKKKKINFFSKVQDEKFVRWSLKRALGLNDDDIVSITMVNIVVVFDMKYLIDLNKNYDDLNDNEFNDRYAGVNHMQSNISKSNYQVLEIQTFPALLRKPFKDKDLSLNTFATGKAVACGLKNDQDIIDIDTYIKKTMLLSTITKDEFKTKKATETTDPPEELLQETTA